MPELPYRDYLSYSKEDRGRQTDSANTGRLATGKGEGVSILQHRAKLKPKLGSWKEGKWFTPSKTFPSKLPRNERTA